MSLYKIEFTQIAIKTVSKYKKSNPVRRVFAEFSRPSVFLKCHRPHFCGKITAVGGSFYCPTGAPRNQDEFSYYAIKCS